MVFHIRRDGAQWVLHAPAAVVACDGPGPPGRSVGVHTRGSGGHVEDSDPQRGEVPGLCPFVLGAPPGRTRDVAGPLPQKEVNLDGRCRQNSNRSSAEP